MLKKLLGGNFLQYGKVEICGVNTSKLKVLSIKIVNIKSYFLFFGKSIIKSLTYNYYPKIFHLFSHPG